MRCLLEDGARGGRPLRSRQERVSRPARRGRRSTSLYGPDPVRRLRRTDTDPDCAPNSANFSLFAPEGRGCTGRERRHGNCAPSRSGSPARRLSPSALRPRAPTLGAAETRMADGTLKHARAAAAAAATRARIAAVIDPALASVASQPSTVARMVTVQGQLPARSRRPARETHLTTICCCARGTPATGRRGGPLRDREAGRGGGVRRSDALRRGWPSDRPGPPCR